MLFTDCCFLRWSSVCFPSQHLSKNPFITFARSISISARALPLHLHLLLRSRKSHLDPHHALHRHSRALPTSTLETCLINWRTNPKCLQQMPARGAIPQLCMRTGGEIKQLRCHVKTLGQTYTRSPTPSCVEKKAPQDIVSERSSVSAQGQREAMRNASLDILVLQGRTMFGGDNTNRVDGARRLHRGSQRLRLRPLLHGLHTQQTKSSAMAWLLISGGHRRRMRWCSGREEWREVRESAWIEVVLGRREASERGRKRVCGENLQDVCAVVLRRGG